MKTDDPFSFYEASFTRLRERLIRVLGVMTVNRLIDRAVVEIARAHPAIANLRCEDDEVELTEVRAAMASSTPEQIRDAFMALDGVLLLLVARLLGREIAVRLTEGMTLEDHLPPDLGGPLGR